MEQHLLLHCWTGYRATELTAVMLLACIHEDVCLLAKRCGNWWHKAVQSTKEFAFSTLARERGLMAL